MLLISPAKAAAAIGAKCGGSAPTTDDLEFLQLLRYMTPRVEAALNVDTLTLGVFNEHVRLPAQPGFNFNSIAYLLPPQAEIRLRNGFVVPDSMTLLDPYGIAVDLNTVAKIDREKGVVYLDTWVYGRYTIEYQAGFEEQEEPLNTPDGGWIAEDKVLVGIPDWIEALVVAYLTLWYRSVYLAPKIPKGQRTGWLTDALVKETMSRLYTKYERPRGGYWAEKA